MSVHRARLVDLVGAASIVLIEGPTGSGKTLLAEDLLADWTAGADGVGAQRWRAGALGERIDADRPWFIDDAHAYDDADAATVLAAIESHQARVVIAGRRLDAFAALGLRGDARLIGASDLSFTVDDVAAEVGGEAPATLIADLVSASAGWAIVVDRALQRLSVDPHWSPSGANGVGVLIRDVVGDTASLAALVCLPLLDDSLIDAGTLSRLPMVRVGRWWSTPAVLAAAIGTELELPVADLVRAARHYIECGEVIVAADLVFDLADPDATLAVFGDASLAALASIEPWRLRQLVAGLPAAPGAAALLLQASRVAERADNESWGAWLQRAAEVVDDDVLARAIAVDRARHRNRTGDFPGSLVDATALLEVIPDDEPATRARALVVVAMAEVYECTQTSLASAIERYREAAALFRRTREWSARSEALARLGYQALFMSGRPLEGEQAMQEALALLSAGDWTRAYWLSYHSDLLDFLGRGVEAEAAVAEAIEIGERLGDEVLIGTGWWQRSWMASHRGDRRAFRTAVDMVERHRGDWLTQGQEVVFLASTAERFLWVDDVEGYLATIARAADLAEETGLTEPVHIARMWFDATHGDAQVALATLADIEETPGVVPVNRTRRLLLSAVARLRLGDEAGARAAVEEAFVLAATFGVPDLPARQHAGLLEQLAPVIGGRRHDETSVVNLRMLGRFGVEHPELGNRTPQPGHPATLVKLLALNGSMSTDSAIDGLWPDVDISTGRSRLRNLLNRLKQQAGALVERDAETLRLSDDVVVDASVFDQAATDALGAPVEERVGRARHALSLYAGDLLPGDMYEDWASGHRERLRRRVVALADIVAVDAEARRDLDEAVRWFELALEIEPLDEQRTIHLCELLAVNGRLASAAKVAQRCSVMLADFGLRPSAALERFAAPGA